MGLADFFSNSFETNDFLDKEYATHYYRCDYNSIKNGISTIAKRLKYDITNIGIFEKEFPYEKEYLGKRIL